MDKKRNYALEERLLQKYFVPQFPDGFLPTMGERIAFKAGMDAAEELYRPLLEAVEWYADNDNWDRDGAAWDGVANEDTWTDRGFRAKEALSKLRKAGEECKYCNSNPCRCIPGN